jgi:hypothetical protein
VLGGIGVSPRTRVSDCESLTRSSDGSSGPFEAVQLQLRDRGDAPSTPGESILIRTVPGTDGPVTFIASVSGTPVYLDTFAIKSLARGDPSLRRRFVTALHNGADLLFSVANVAELVGPQGASSEAFGGFLDEVGAHWYPVELDPFEVARRESQGFPAEKSCFSPDFLKAYFTSQTSGYSPGCGRVIDLSEQFFRLGAFIDWVAPQRDSIRTSCEEYDRLFFDRVSLCRAELKRDREWFDRKLPILQFNPSKPATFAVHHLVRNLILDNGYHLKKGDGMDFCHAVMASAFASFGALDKHWKRRVEKLPKPNQLARIYYEPEISKMIADIESALQTLVPPKGG